MGLYLRKALRVGPLRFNLSKGGIGVSAGLPGFRVGTGPRGNYVHMGANGIYYRSALPTSGNQRPSAAAAPALNNQAEDPAIPDGTVGPAVEIESAPTSQLIDSSSAELLSEMQRKKARPRHLFFALILSAVAVGFSFARLPSPWPMAVLALAGAMCVYIHLRDVVAKTVVLFYDFDDTMARAYEGLQSAGKHLATARGLWHVQSRASVNDRRYHAGANNLSSLGNTRVSFAPAPFLRTNVDVFSIPVGKQVLYFFPDRLLIADSSGIGAVSYKELQLRIEPVRFIEDRPVPADAEVVDHTWRYLNKNGTPDKRFRDNRQIPICLYSEMHFTTSSGLNEMLIASRPALAKYFDEHLSYIKARVPEEGIAKVLKN